MSWVELKIDTTPEAVDWVRTLLSSSDCISDIEITPYASEAGIQPGTESVEPSWSFTIRFYLPHNVQASTRVEKIEHLLASLHRTALISELQTHVVEEKPIHPEPLSPLIHRIGERFVVLNTDTPYQSDATDEILLRIDKTFTFGSGLHPATILSLRLLERYIIPTMSVLDLGSGSGILSVAIAKLGAQVLALDNDSKAVQASQAAARQNGVEHQVTVMEASLGQGSSLGHWMGLESLGPVPTVQSAANFDLIAANIFARVHIALAEEYRTALRRTSTYTGLLIASGFTTDYEDEIEAAFAAAGFETIDCERLDEWVAFTYRVKG